MLTFLIVAAAMTVAFLFDMRFISKDTRPAVKIFYGVLTLLSLAILTLNSFGVDLPSIYGF